MIHVGYHFFARHSIIMFTTYNLCGIVLVVSHSHGQKLISVLVIIFLSDQLRYRLNHDCGPLEWLMLVIKLSLITTLDDLQVYLPEACVQMTNGNCI